MAAEQAIIKVLRSQAAQAARLGDRAVRRKADRPSNKDFRILSICTQERYIWCMSKLCCSFLGRHVTRKNFFKLFFNTLEVVDVA